MFGEGLGYMYAASYGISVVCVRIGNFSGQRRDPEHPHHLGIPDCVQLFSECLAILRPVEMAEVVLFAAKALTAELEPRPDPVADARDVRTPAAALAWLEPRCLIDFVLGIARMCAGERAV